jgi:hypothetical protein
MTKREEFDACVIGTNRGSAALMIRSDRRGGSCRGAAARAFLKRRFDAESSARSFATRCSRRHTTWLRCTSPSLRARKEPDRGRAVSISLAVLPLARTALHASLRTPRAAAVPLPPWPPPPPPPVVGASLPAAQPHTLTLALAPTPRPRSPRAHALAHAHRTLATRRTAHGRSVRRHRPAHPPVSTPHTAPTPTPTARQCGLRRLTAHAPRTRRGTPVGSLRKTSRALSHRSPHARTPPPAARLARSPAHARSHSRLAHDSRLPPVPHDPPRTRRSTRTPYTHDAATTLSPPPPLLQTRRTRAHHALAHAHAAHTLDRRHAHTLGTHERSRVLLTHALGTHEHSSPCKLDLRPSRSHASIHAQSHSLSLYARRISRSRGLDAARTRRAHTRT